MGVLLDLGVTFGWSFFAAEAREGWRTRRPIAERCFTLRYEDWKMYYVGLVITLASNPYIVHVLYRLIIHLCYARVKRPT